MGRGAGAPPLCEGGAWGGEVTSHIVRMCAAHRASTAIVAHCVTVPEMELRTRDSAGGRDKAGYAVVVGALGSALSIRSVIILMTALTPDVSIPAKDSQVVWKVSVK